jgi:formylmethanofuran dehydrogenase subunit E
MVRIMPENPPTKERLILVSCSECGQLHEPIRAMALNPVCTACSAHAAGSSARAAADGR